MKVWLVLALLAMGLVGLRCSQEAPEPWSSASRVVIVEGCIDVFEDEDTDFASTALSRTMAAKGITPRDFCRCVLYEVERHWTESDFYRFETAESHEAVDKAIIRCRKELLD